MSCSSLILQVIRLKLCTQTATIWWRRSKLQLDSYLKVWPFSCISNMSYFFIFVLSFIRSNVLYSPTFISHFHKLQSVSFQMVTRICISLLQGLSYRQLQCLAKVFGPLELCDLLPHFRLQT